MKKNMGTLDRLLRIIIGLALLWYAFLAPATGCNWIGFLGPAALPAPIVNKLSESFARVAKVPEVVAALDAEGSMAVGSTPAQFRQRLVIEMERWRKVVQENGIKGE